MNIYCPNLACIKKQPFVDCKSYAQHIIDKHSKDSDRYEWALHTLDDYKQLESMPVVEEQYSNSALVKQIREEKAKKDDSLINAEEV
jgi:hypothetical protein